MVLEYEPMPGGSKKNEEKEAIAQLHIAEQTARTYLRQCGNEVIEQEKPEEFMAELFYILLNRKKSNSVGFVENAAEALDEYFLAVDKTDKIEIPISSLVMPKEIKFQKGLSFLWRSPRMCLCCLWAKISPMPPPPSESARPTPLCFSLRKGNQHST